MTASALLLVDNNPDVWGSLSDIISDLRYQVDVAEDGPTALELSRRHPSEALLTKDKTIILAIHGYPYLLTPLSSPRSDKAAGTGKGLSTSKAGASGQALPAKGW